MMGVFYEFDEVDAFTVGAVGQPGQRVFLLQARRGATRVTVKCEKQQAAAIADYLRKVMSDLPPPADQPLPAAMELAEPVEPAFVLGPIGLGYDRDNDRRAGAARRGRPRRRRGRARPRRCRGPRPRARLPHPRPGRGVVRSHRRRSSPPAVRRASGAATRSTQTATHVRG